MIDLSYPSRCFLTKGLPSSDEGNPLFLLSFPTRIPREPAYGFASENSSIRIPRLLNPRDSVPFQIFPSPSFYMRPRALPATRFLENASSLPRPISPSDPETRQFLDPQTLSIPSLNRCSQLLFFPASPNVCDNCPLPEKCWLFVFLYPSPFLMHVHRPLPGLVNNTFSLPRDSQISFRKAFSFRMSNSHCFRISLSLFPLNLSNRAILNDPQVPPLVQRFDTVQGDSRALLSSLNNLPLLQDSFSFPFGAC